LEGRQSIDIAFVWQHAGEAEEAALARWHCEYPGLDPINAPPVLVRWADAEAEAIGSPLTPASR
jgi:hypothetical protein